MGSPEGESREHSEGELSEELRTPSMYKVFLLNDDYTTMDFVVHVLESVFHKTPSAATQLMLEVHKNGSAVCGVYTKDIAETKIITVHDLAAKNEFPLKCIMEEE
ncbi:MAG: ATP-dependent Clp protease adapter ClpS [Nitrospirae bacterium]|nr:ATP-dependent Clp protease adapter ClpS [Nitrospirota bacterium]